MARLPIDKKRLNRLAGGSVARYIDFVYSSSKVVTEPDNVGAFLAQQRPAIIAVWHGQFLLAPKAKPLEFPLAIMLARHGDAELFAEALARFNTTLIRGAGAGERRKDRGGAQAMRACMRKLDENIFVGMTADVPPGPARRVGEGIIMLARLSGRPIIPLAAATTRYHAFPTWSRMTLNLPYGTLGSVFGDPIFVPRDADAATLEAARLAVQDGLNRATARAYALAGADPRRATPSLEETAGRRTANARRISRHGESEPSRASADAAGEDAPAGRGPAGRGVAPGIGLEGYRLVTRLIGPSAMLLLGARARRGKEDPARRSERLGRSSLPRPDGTLVWMHAASVGEINAVLPLADAMRAGLPDLRFLFTTGTVTSAAVAARRLGPGDIHQYVPLDSPTFVRRFLSHWRPDMAVLTESEIWPNIVLETSRRSIPLTLVNARMSNRSFERWSKMPSAARALVSRFDLVLAQNDAIASRFAELGAPRAIAVGNLKIDAPAPAVDDGKLAHLRAALSNRPVLVVASTHPGEEQIVAAAHRLLGRERPDFCTILAPRHPERGTEIAETLKSAGFAVAQRSLGALPSANTEIYIADTIGELGTLFALTWVAFVGGSLVERGGQNPIEAIRHGAVVVTGPHYQNFADAYQALLAEEAVAVVSGAEDLAAVVSRLLRDEVELRRMRDGAETALAGLSGALQRTAHELLALMPHREELLRAV